MKTIQIRCTCGATTHVGAMQGGKVSLLLKGMCPNCRVIIVCRIDYDNLQRRCANEKGEHVILSSAVEVEAAHA